MKKILLLFVFYLYALSFYGQLKDFPVRFISVNGNYDYETLYYYHNGKVGSFTNLFYELKLNKGDSIWITTEITSIEIPGDNSFMETEVIRDIKLIEKGKLSCFLELCTPDIEYVLKEPLGSIYEELLPKEMNLFFAASGLDEINEIINRNKNNTIRVYATTHSLMEGETWVDNHPRIEGEIRYLVGENEEFIMYYGITPDYDHTMFYRHVQGNQFEPIYFEYW